MTFDINSTAQSFATFNSKVEVPSFTSIDGRERSEPKSSFDTGEYQIQTFNGLDYKIELFLDNSGNFDMTKKKQFFINPQAIINMSLIDTLNDWVVEGSLTFMYVPEGLSITSKQRRDTGQNKKTQINGAIENGKLLSQYEFRGDGYDMLRLSLRPVPSNIQTSSFPDALTINENDPKWILSYLFSIYEIEDLSDNPQLQGPMSAYTRLLRLKFHDVRYQILKTTNLEYSTAQSPEAVIDQTLANGSLGVLPTGKAMLEILNAALADSKQVSEGNTSIEFYQLPGDKDWDVNEESKIFYTSPAGYTALDDLDYVYGSHVGPKIPDTDINDFCLLHAKRSSTPGGLDKICLTPVSKIFKEATSEKTNAGPLQIEHFFVTTHTKEEEDVNPVDAEYKAPNPVTNPNVLKTFKYGQIVSYSFVDMSPSINSDSFTTTPVYSVDIGKRQFNIQFKNNDVKSARKTIADGYIKHLYKNNSNNLEELFLPIIHNHKKTRSVFPTFSLNGDNEKVRQRNGIHHLLYTGLFQNACICFKTLGLTLREPGTFIGIDKTLGTVSNDFTNKVYGQYLVVRVDHIFEQGAYMNVIWAVKIHRYDKRVAKFDNTLT